MTSHKLVRVHDQELSWWQSIVTQYVIDNEKKSAPGKQITVPDVQEHPMVVALNTHVKRAVSPVYLFKSKYEPNASEAKADSLRSELAFQIAKAKIRKNIVLEAELYELYRKYSNDDPGFLTCAGTYAKAWIEYGGVKKYYDWQENSGGLNFGKIKYKLPNTAKVAIIGDWGTGMQDAKHLLKAIMSHPTDKPDVIIHLGDIYYSATPDECIANFSDIITAVFNEVLGQGQRIPVFGIPGNHDYYSMGYAYYAMMNGLNQFNQDAVQLASYFCLTTEDNGWQFLGMDTGYNDANPADAMNPRYAGPALQPSEYEWHFDKLQNFSGATIVLSHHQLFSSNAKINGSDSAYSGYPNINKYLLENFQPFFSSKIAGWLWGHEHNQVIYSDGNFGLAKGRLIGASAYEETTGDNPYRVNYPNVPINTAVELGSANGYFNHGYVIVDLGARATPTAPVSLRYYEYPSWDHTCIPVPIPALATPMYSERMALPQPPATGAVVNYGASLNINLENGLSFIGPYSGTVEYYPTLGLRPVNLQITGGSGPVMDGDVVQIVTMERNAGSYNVLGAWGTSELYYYTSGYDNQNWIIQKVNGSNGSQIHENDAVYLVNQYYPGQYVCPYSSVLGMFLTTDAEVQACWFLKLTTS